jgi:TRAP transporter 4TM/12TM fusion protein
VLEATRRTVGWVLPAVCVAFLLYAYYGGYLPADWAIGHKGYGIARIVEQLYMTTEGLYGVPLDVAATYIVLFTIYGAVLDLSGAGQFFLDLSFAAFRRSRSAPGRTVTMAGFLLGTVSGSGTATAVSLGSVSWPILRRAGYPREQAGGVLAAAGIGAILSPPTLGAAAFIIAEFLRVSYLTVLLYAIVPTLLYYLGILLAIEMDARRFGTRAVDVDAPPFWRLLARFGYHFSSLIVIVVLLALELSVFRAVVYATLLAFALSFLDRNHRMGPRRAFQALANGARSVLPIAATCAAAGIIVGITTLTGLGLNLSGIIVDVAGGLSDNATVMLLATVVLAAVAVLVLGLAIPVTASFVIAAVIIAPALKTLGASDAETYMFIFYYAVLSEVSPPTALAAVASAAITGGNVMRTMLQTLKYALPAFLVPFAFVLTPAGEGLLGQGPLPQVLLVTLVSAVAVVALAVTTGGKGSFDSPQPIRALARIYTNYTQVLVRSDAGITSVEQMKGKTVSTGSPNSGTEVIAERLLTAAGVDPAAGIKRQKLSLPETVQGMKDGTIQAMFWSGGLPTAGVTDLVTSLKGQVRFLDLTPYLSKLQSQYGPVYQAATIAPAVYKQAAPAPTIGVPNMLVVKDSMSDDLAFKLTELLFTKQAELAKVHPEAKNIKRELATQTDPVQLHPGAKRYFDGS